MKHSFPGILLDTHTWIWYLSDPERLSEDARQIILRAQSKESIFISAISTWEVAMLVKKQRLSLRMDVADWLRLSDSLPFLRFVPVENRILLKSVFLDSEVPSDPADRIIAATALSLGLPLVSKDTRMRQIPSLDVIW